MENTYTEPYLNNQSELNDLVRNLNLSKSQAEILGPRLKEFSLLQQNTKISVFRDRQSEFEHFFSQYKDLVYCNDVDSLLVALGHMNHPEEWRLFIYRLFKA